MDYTWEESYDIFGLDSLNPHDTRMESGVRKLIKEKKMKKLLAEKELENAMLRDALKNRWQGNNEHD